ncbi:MAG: AAA family ATPase [Candidatus Dependentiae bacterium]|nr:AAA family ATPase [Candidatus Dependentiae bacterium]
MNRIFKLLLVALCGYSSVGLQAMQIRYKSPLQMLLSGSLSATCNGCRGASSFHSCGRQNNRPEGHSMSSSSTAAATAASSSSQTETKHEEEFDFGSTTVAKLNISRPHYVSNDQNNAALDEKQHAELNPEQATENSELSRPTAYTELLSKDLQAEVIKQCPDEVKALIKLIQTTQKGGRDISDDIKLKRLVLVGLPGTGKTTLGQAIAQECKLPCFMYKATLIADQYKNSGDKNLEHIFKEALKLKKPCVVIIDELQTLLERNKDKNDSDKNMTPSLWTMFDACEKSDILFIGLLNHLEEEPKKQFIGRVDYIIEIAMSDDEKRENLFNYYFNQNPGAIFPTKSLPTLIKKTKNHANRDIKWIISRAVRSALINSKDTDIKIEVTMKDFDNALEAHEEQGQKLIDPEIKSWTSSRNLMKYAKYALTAAPYILKLGHMGYQYWTQNRQMKAQEAQAEANEVNANHSAALQREGLDLQAQGAAEQRTMNEFSRTMQESGHALQQQGLSLQREGHTLQTNSAAEQKAVNELSKNMQLKSHALQEQGLNLQRDGHALQTNSATEQRAMNEFSRTMQTESHALQAQGAKTQAKMNDFTMGATAINSSNETDATKNKAVVKLANDLCQDGKFTTEIRKAYSYEVEGVLAKK